jgi:hypothetical protein
VDILNNLGNYYHVMGIKNNDYYKESMNLQIELAE